MSSEKEQKQDQPQTPETPQESAPEAPEEPTQPAESEPEAEPEITDTKIELNLEVGKTYITRGGWPVLIIWYHSQSGYFYAIHKPFTQEEHPPTTHNRMGQACTTFSVHAAPDYGLHPADIISDKPIED